MLVEIVLLFVLVLVYAVLRDRRPRNCPPGPFEIPFFGGLPIIDEGPAEDLKKKYGDVVMYRTGSFRNVFLFDYNTAKEAMARLEFADRPIFFSTFSIDDKKLGGLLGSNGVHWQHDRRFVLRNLRKLGMGKSYLEEAINIEAKALVEDLKKYGGEAINYPDSFRTVALNIIWQMVASTRFDLRSTEVEAIYKVSKEFQTKFTPIMFLPSFVPVLDYLPKCVKNYLFNEHIVDEFFDEMKAIVKATIDQHLKDYDPDNIRDLMDEYIKGIKDGEGDDETFFRKGALGQIINDLFQAGSDTVNFQLKWVAYLLARYPEYATRMQQQIDAVVPRDRMVSLDDKPGLPLIEAFVMETMRYSSMITMNVQRSATRDTTINGYFIPKDTIIIVSNYSVHHDPRYWEEPDKFYPERFLDENGTKFTAPKQGFFAFGSGRRHCVGELLARMELFLFTAAIVQHFDVRPPHGVDIAEEGVRNYAGLRVPADRKLVYKPRD
ncbi:Cytochrome P450 CYP3214A7 [Hyalella azteca]|uniref:Cytochrome P450 2L1 isoform X1 n=1 Tax=Hyalella azteca TaxID=294128 RepID=A0A6A0H7G1_HYAAZ|nr:cytochrome P450 2L1 isoform X2 [Hyalella azteca]XP_018026594.1 cytochrome P450 2L1 isoform X1 [Hyalella azteca]KAA0200344.1 Cytochrome P450 CYP3214A7 [Hyalella azteca]